VIVRHHVHDHTLRIDLPPGYTAASRYPVLYLCDGQNLFDRGESAIHPTWGVDTVMDELVSNGDVEPWIVVGIDHAGVARLAEYSLWNEPRVGVLANGERFVRFVTDELTAWVAQHFSVRTGAASTAIGGSSMGGLIALAIAGRYPERFGRVLAMSPAVMWRDEAIVELWPSKPDPAPRVYLDAGAHERFRAGSWEVDYRVAVGSFASHLARIGYTDDDLRFVLDPDGHHHESDWHRRLPDALRWLLRNQ
jgi:enterochelin esterase-like enzyme